MDPVAPVAPVAPVECLGGLGVSLRLDSKPRQYYSSVSGSEMSRAGDDGNLIMIDRSSQHAQVRVRLIT